MRIRWSPAAAHDLQQLFNYIRSDNPSAAQRVARTIYDRITNLGVHPHLGRPGRIEATRELPLPPLPFVVVYRVLESADLGRNCQHGSRGAALAA